MESAGQNNGDMHFRTRTVAIYTLGCKLNQAETESLSRKFTEKGYQITYSSGEASIYVLNTCTVTHVAERRSRHLLRLAKRNNPHALTVAIGCYAQRAASELAQEVGADIALGNTESDLLFDILETRLPAATGYTPPYKPQRTRSFVKVQEGCNQFCSYCIVPTVRGRERSLPIDEVMADIKTKLNTGHREIVLTGTRIGAYSYGLEQLIERILTETSAERIRVSSLQPQEITPGLLDLWRDSRLCRHIHLPLQSGSDSVLRRMGRHYTTGEYAIAASKVRESIPDVAITTDVMVGFPQETASEFEDSYRFCRMIEFAKIHVFPYSQRPGTRAELIQPKVSNEIKKARTETMLKLAAESARHFKQRFVGHNMLVLWERELNEERWAGLTDNYIKVIAQSAKPLHNEITLAKLKGERDRYMEASVTA